MNISFDADGFTVATTIGSKNTLYCCNGDGGTNTTFSTYVDTAAVSATITLALQPKFLIVMDNGRSLNAPLAYFERFVGTISYLSWVQTLP
ncbi:MAG: hypothetical protein RIQ70_729 [Bacteroidota bacterium]|jgi:hypothetical protein